MAYGPLATNSMATADMVAPGMPVFVAANQVSNNIIRLTIALPTMDANGTNLSGLTKLTVVSLPMTDGINPFDGLGMPEALGLPGVQKIDVAVVEADAGTEKQVDVAVMNLGGVQAFGAACADD